MEIREAIGGEYRMEKKVRMSPVTVRFVFEASTSSSDIGNTCIQLTAKGKYNAQRPVEPINPPSADISEHTARNDIADTSPVRERVPNKEDKAVRTHVYL